MDAHPDPELVSLFKRAAICKAFPAYTLESVTEANASDLLRALELLDLARRATEPIT